MAETHVVSALMAKRSEVAGAIADLERRAAQQRADLVHFRSPDIAIARVWLIAVITKPFHSVRAAERAQVVG
jgi:hypothetical protein